ncbi:hypothetical protein V2I01_35910 [Micromonospora sp. BRA006-A]|nr:hypothetical protein [Micromonospora sp. BRA006-A]
MPVQASTTWPPTSTPRTGPVRPSPPSALALIRTPPPAEAEAVMLRAVIGLDAETAGRVLGRRAGAVRTAAHRGLRRLAALLERSAAQAAPEDTGTPSRRVRGPSARCRAPEAEPAEG